jgi:hypothetical protein
MVQSEAYKMNRVPGWYRYPVGKKPVVDVPQVYRCAQVHVGTMDHKLQVQYIGNNI